MHYYKSLPFNPSNMERDLFSLPRLGQDTSPYIVVYAKDIPQSQTNHPLPRMWLGRHSSLETYVDWVIAIYFYFFFHFPWHSKPTNPHSPSSSVASSGSGRNFNQAGSTLSTSNTGTPEHPRVSATFQIEFGGGTYRHVVVLVSFALNFGVCEKNAFFPWPCRAVSRKWRKCLLAVNMDGFPGQECCRCGRSHKSTNGRILGESLQKKMCFYQHLIKNLHFSSLLIWIWNDLNTEICRLRLK